MLLRRKQSRFNALAAVLAVAAVLVYAFAPPGNHDPSLHFTGVQTIIGQHSLDHGDHSHDEFDVSDDADIGGGHHHADHSHEKIDLTASSGVTVRLFSSPQENTLESNLAEGPLHGIDRPPRTLAHA